MARWTNNGCTDNEHRWLLPGFPPSASPPRALPQFQGSQRQGASRESSRGWRSGSEDQSSDQPRPWPEPGAGGLGRFPRTLPNTRLVCIDVCGRRGPALGSHGELCCTSSADAIKRAVTHSPSCSGNFHESPLRRGGGRGRRAKGCSAQARGCGQVCLESKRARTVAEARVPRALCSAAGSGSTPRSGEPAPFQAVTGGKAVDDGSH